MGRPLIFLHQKTTLKGINFSFVELYMFSSINKKPNFFNQTDNCKNQKAHVCVYICTCYTYKYTYMYMLYTCIIYYICCTHVYIHDIHICAYIHIYTYINMHICIYTYMYVCVQHEGRNSCNIYNLTMQKTVKMDQNKSVSRQFYILLQKKNLKGIN